MDFKKLYKEAKQLATEKHANQKYGDTRPYTVHLNDVDTVLRRFGVDPDLSDQNKNLLVGAWLHDVIEDTNVSFDQVKTQFGEEIATLVYAVTNEPGPNRKARHLNTYPKIQKHPYAVILKLADRIANVEESVRNQSPQLNMYRNEFIEFRAKLQKPGEAKEMWDHLIQLLGHCPSIKV